MKMSRFIVKRFFLMLIVLLGVTVLTFLITTLVPGDPLVANLGQSALDNPEIIANFEAKWGLNEPLHIQYLTYMKNLLKGDMGISISSKQPVTEELARYWPATFELATLATIMSIVLGLLFGLISASKKDKLPDQILRVISLIGISIPAFWLSLLCLNLFYLKLDWIPGSGRLGLNYVGFKYITGFILIDCIIKGDFVAFKDAFSHMIMPAIILAAATMGIITRTVRSSMLDVMGQDYLRTARAKGLSEKIVVGKHALKNGLIPSVTMFGLSYGSLLGGTVLVETIFDYQGLGWFAYQSAKTLDLPAVMGVALVIAVIYSVVNLIVDVVYALIDPRIRY